MQRKYLGLSIVLLLSFFIGCIEGPTSPISTIPRILIDHIEDTGETKIFVCGIEDHLYSNITIEISEESVFENFTYELHMSTRRETFLLNVSVWDEQKQYEYSGNIAIVTDNDQIQLEITDDRHKEPIEKSFPYTIIMERKE